MRGREVTLRARTLLVAALLLAMLAMVGFLWLDEPDRALEAGERPSNAAPSADAGRVTDRPARRPRAAPAAEPVLDPDAFERLLAASEEARPPEGLDDAVACPLARAVPPTGGVLMLRWKDRLSADHAAWANGDRVWLVVPYDDGSGYLHLRGYQPVDLGWSLGPAGEVRCDPDPVPLLEGGASVQGTVRNAEGEPEGRVWVEGCGGHALTDADGAYYLEALPGPCTLRAFRQDGLFTALGEPVELTLAPDQDAIQDLSVPDWPQAGIGAVVEATEGGVRVRELVEGGSAAEQGLAPGDLVVAVDGEPTDGMELADFVERVVAREGTPVTLVLERDGQRREVELVRKAIQAGE